jgi:PAS domain S-box-containing protein
MAIFPKVGKPWTFGIHQCSYPRIWKPEECHLLQEIGQRIADVLTGLLMFRDLSESEEKFRELVENMDEIFWIRDAKTNEMIYISPNFEDTWGLSAKLATGKPDSLLAAIHPADREKVAFIFPNPKGNQPVELEYRIVKPDGSVRWMHGKNFPILDRSGNVYRRVGINEDITKKKQMENDLIQSQKMEAIGTLAGGIAHDFNNILSSVIGFTELALDDVEKDSMIEDNLQEVYIASKRAKELVAQILAFARQSEEEQKPIQVGIIIKEVLQFIRSSIPATIEIRRNINSDSLIMGNQTQIHQIMMNLCTNAAHAMEDTGGVLDVSLRDVSINRRFSNKKLDLNYGDYIKIVVSDTGTGIPPDIVDSIFEPYFTTKGPGEGIGMGLAMVLGIVESYGGKIIVESKTGQGSTFIIYLPVTIKRKTRHQYVQRQLPTGTERILFVDDEAPIVKYGSRGLERLGYHVASRTSSIEALELFKSKPDGFDLVITDMTMPHMTGDILAVEMMKIRRDIPVILCTGYSKKISDESASEIGIKAFAYKPIVKADLAKTVRKVLDETKSENQV